MAPFTVDSQMYITVSKSDKNKGRYYYGYDGQWLNWVDNSALGGLVSTLQSDGVKWYFAPGVIAPEVSDKLTLDTSAPKPLQPVAPPRQYQTYQPPQAPQFSYPSQPSQPSQTPQPPPSSPQIQHMTGPGPAVDPRLREELKNLADQVSDLREIMARVNAQFIEYNAQYKLGLSLKRRRMTEGIALNHTLPGNFNDNDSTDDGEGEREDAP